MILHFTTTAGTVYCINGDRITRTAPTRVVGHPDSIVNRPFTPLDGPPVTGRRFHFQLEGETGTILTGRIRKVVPR